MKHDSKWWKPLLFLAPIILFYIDLRAEFTDLWQWFLFQIVLVMSFIWALIAQFEGAKPDWSSEEFPMLKTEQAYLIRVNKDLVLDGGFPILKGYPMIVGINACEKALATGDYDYEGVATEETAGGFYFNDGYMPAGHIEAGAQYRDERLN